jgi:hypothetical protein
MSQTRSGVHGMTKRLSTDKLVRRHLGVSRIESLVSATRHCLSYPSRASGSPEEWIDPMVRTAREGRQKSLEKWVSE